MNKKNESLIACPMFTIPRKQKRLNGFVDEKMNGLNEITRQTTMKE